MSAENAKKLADILTIGGWAIAFVFIIALIEFTYERKLGKRSRQGNGVMKPLWLGVVVPLVFGAGALFLTLGLV